MKKELNTRISGKISFRHLLLSGAALFAIGTLGAQNSVVIEGGPNGAEITETSGAPESATSKSTPGTDTKTRAALNEGSATATSPTEICPIGLRDKASLDTIEVAKAQRMDQLENDLGIADSGTEAEVTFSAEDVFDENELNVRTVAEATLGEVAEYAELRKPEQVEVLYLYSSRNDSEAQARKRSANLATYLDKQISFEEVDFISAKPEIVKEPVPQNGKPGQILETLESIVVISMR